MTISIKQSVIFFAILCLFALLLSPVFSASLIDTKTELQNVKSELKVEKRKLEEANKKEKNFSAQLREKQDALYSAHIKVKEASSLLSTTEKELKRMKAELISVEKVYGKHQKELEARLQNIYENVDPSYLAAFTEVKNFSEFINTLNYLQMLVEDDFTLLNRLEREKLEVARKKVSVEDRYNKVLDIKKELNDKELHLASIVREKQDLLATIHSDRESHSGRIIKLEDNAQELETQIQKIINGHVPSLNYSASFSGGNGSLSCWPASGPITSPFGWRIHPIYGDWRFHSGVDIAADYGSPIQAAGDGVVITSEWVGGYGNTLMIDHGGGIVSLYGHCSSLLVTYGQHVTKGQTVAYVGSTGNSTGPHLHFEVRQYGVAVDPYGFVH